MRTALLGGAMLAACGSSPAAPDARAVDAAAPDAAGTAQVRILAFNDFHGHLEAAARLGAAIDARRTAATLVISAGDLIGGSPMISGLFHDVPAAATRSTAALATSRSTGRASSSSRPTSPTPARAARPSSRRTGSSTSTACGSR